MLPGMDGFDVCRALKKNTQTATVPLIMLTAKGEESDIVVGLELGADDYITKPFSPKILFARIRALLRRHERKAVDKDSVLQYGGLSIDPLRHEVLIQGKPTELTATEFGVLHFLIQHPGWAFTRQQIVDAVKGQDYTVTERTVDI